MGNPKRIGALLEMADEDLVGAERLLDVSTRLARYHVQQSAEKAVKALLEFRGLNPGREHRFEMLSDMLPRDDPWRTRIFDLHELSPVATTRRYPTAEGRVISPPARSMVEAEIDATTKLIADVKQAVEVLAKPAPTSTHGR
jgi:HEPN domain-containing protein